MNNPPLQKGGKGGFFQLVILLVFTDLQRQE